MANEPETGTVAEPGMGMQIWRSVFRHDYPQTDLDRMSTMFTNFFLHLLPAKVHPNCLRLTYTWALGLISFFLMGILFVSGFLLMFFYIPSTDWAYHSMKDLQFLVSFGPLLRNMHRSSAHALVAVVFLHLCRVLH